MAGGEPDLKSVFDELVPLFVAAAANRQVIIVTHSANLVINTDADQIIVAESGPQRRTPRASISGSD
jgi:predicted ATPase